MAAKRKPIKIKKQNIGKLRKTAHTKKGKKMSVASIKKLEKSSNPATRKRAVFADNARKWNKGKKKKK